LDDLIHFDLVLEEVCYKCPVEAPRFPDLDGAHYDICLAGPILNRRIAIPFCHATCSAMASLRADIPPAADASLLRFVLAAFGFR